MKAFQIQTRLFLILILSQAATVFGDSFYDLGLNWTQWIPNQGQVKRSQPSTTPGSTSYYSMPAPTPGRIDPVAFHAYLQASTAAANASSSSNYTPPSNTTQAYIPATAPVVTTPTTTPVYASQPTNYGSTTSFDFGVGSSSGSPAPSFSQSIGSSSRYDALINMGSGPYPLANQLLTGTAQPWYQSPVVQSIYGGTPNADQQKSFEQDVLQKVQQTYALSGINVNLTLDPNATAARTISVVSGASYGSIQDAAGITADNNNGFSFIDKLNGAKNLTDLEWAVAHNVAHEMMHSFGVDHHDTSGQFLDGAIANWNLLLDPNTKFSSIAASDLQHQFAAGLSDNSNSTVSGFLGQQIASADALIIAPQPVPEPTTVAIWIAGVAIALVARNKRRNA